MFDFNSIACKSQFDPAVDKAAVDQFGFVDLRKAYSEGVISGAVSFDDDKFNGVQDPSCLLHRGDDKFARMRQADSVKSQLRSAKAAAKASAEQVTPSGEN